jgi:hypothetical protein
MGGLARVVVDLLYEIGGGPDGPGVTLDQLIDRVIERPPPGVLYGAINLYASDILRTRRGVSDIGDIIEDDGAQGVTILTNPKTGQPWFTHRQAVRLYMRQFIHASQQKSRWLVRDDDRYRIASPEAGPRVPGIGPYNAAARASLDNIDQDHAKRVSVKTRGEQIDDPELARAVLAHYFHSANRKDAYGRRRIDYKRMNEALADLRDPDVIRETLIDLVRRAVPPTTAITTCKEI